MQKWKQKAIVQKIISFLPLSQQINYIFQKYVTKGVNLSDEYFYDRLAHARDHLKAFQKYGNKPIPATCLEIGTGWYPIVPISFFLVGTDQIYSVDISFLTSKKRIKTTLEKLVTCYDLGQLKNHFDFIPSKLEITQDILLKYDTLSLEEILQKLNIIYLIEDARKLSLAGNSVDLINSNNTFEHIYPDILIPIMAEFNRVVKKQNGVMSHFIDLSDHFAHLDSSINIYNFLQFSDLEWKWIDNSIQPQNRLRIYDYKQIYSDLKIPISEESFREGNLGELTQISLADKFKNKPLEETAISHCHFISNMAKKEGSSKTFSI
ncbi:class I SAM-dependent methyltransferase [Pedobacter cryophilus]|uniref:Class I SAM-dependent methyltransferase n=1 Tax=Pedobacter cryophilus TaxID=2571271 RepID=A0A4U1C1S8_9SPHI|nr:class I SAM-dependent methyltransferase [Pedobacter cryophilus]TKB98944.1 class I SAM-dependent methyltransferase [Pedobacter cryophilus]